MVPRQPAPSRPISDCGRTGGDEAGSKCRADDERQGLGEWQRASWPVPRSLSSVSRLTSGPTVGCQHGLAESEKRGEADTKAIRPVAATGSAARPNTAQETPRISPLTAQRAASPGAPHAAQDEQLG